VAEKLEMIKRILRFTRSAVLIVFGIIIFTWAGIWIWFAWDMPDARAALKTDVPACELVSTKPIEFTQLHIDALAAVEFPEGLNPPLLPSIRALLTPLVWGISGRLFHRGLDASTSLARILLVDFFPPERTIQHQLRLIVFADMIEAQLGEKEIGEALLARTYFGKKAIGLTCAAALHYRKKVDELSLAQFAMLVGLIRSPSSYDPTKLPDRAIARRNQVLDVWAQRGLSTAVDIERAKLEPIQ
jgi:hypothetical protein